MLISRTKHIGLLSFVCAIFLQSCSSSGGVYRSSRDFAPLPKLDQESLQTFREDIYRLGGMSREDLFLRKPNLSKIDSVFSLLEREEIVKRILDEAYSYLGTPYRFGGLSRSGIDCSALVLLAFGSATEIELPRISVLQSKEGLRLSKGNLRRGDLIFFSTKRNGKVSHVGIVDHATGAEIKFIHASSSKGVSISSLNSNYWNSRFLFGKRIVLDHS